MTPRSGSLIRWTGFLVGCLIGVGLVLAGRVPEGRAAAGVALEVSSAPTRLLAVSPAGKPFLEARDLRPGAGPVEGPLELQNLSGRELAVRLRLEPGDRDLDRLVQVALTTDNKRVFRGTLSELRSRSAARFGMAPKARRQLALRAWVPASVKHDFQGRSAKLWLELRTAEAGG